MCAASSVFYKRCSRSLAEIWWGNPRLTKTIEINLVLVMNDYFRCVKTNGSSKSNTKLLTVVTEVTIWFKWSDPHDVVVVKIASWITTEARIMTEVGAKLRSAGRMPPADQFNPVRQTLCTTFQAPRFRVWTAVQYRTGCCLSFVDFALCPVPQWPGSREFGPRVETFGNPWIMA